MKFTWDERKRRANILNHGFDFVDAKEVFEGITSTLEDDRFDYGEERFTTLGLLKDTTVVIAHTEKGNEIRAIPCERQQSMSRKSTLKGSQTDWERINAMSDNEIDTSEIPEITEEQMKRLPSVLAENPFPKEKCASTSFWMQRWLHTSNHRPAENELNFHLGHVLTLLNQFGVRSLCHGFLLGKLSEQRCGSSL